MREENVHHEQMLQQLQLKFEEETFQQQEEIDRAMESKLNEQRALLQKGFDEKAQLMDLEIEQLKKEKENQSGGIFKDNFLPLLDVAKDVLNSILQYKATVKSLKSSYF